MKRHVQVEGIRLWAGDDLLELQSEPFKALDGFFAQYGPCVIQGCAVTTNGSRYDVAPGLVVLKGADHTGTERTMVVPFAGATGVSLPLYLTLSFTEQAELYEDGNVKPILYDYRATASTVKPAGNTPYLEVVVPTGYGTAKFVDVIQDPLHRLITDTERTRWNTVTAIGDQLNALVAGAPANLNTLKKIAAAINNDPQFYLTINNELEAIRNRQFRVTDISGWTGDLTLTTTNSVIPVTKDTSRNALYLMIHNQPKLRAHPFYELMSFAWSEAFTLQNSNGGATIKIRDARSFETGVVVLGSIIRIYEILP